MPPGESGESAHARMVRTRIERVRQRISIARRAISSVPRAAAIRMLASMNVRLGFTTDGLSFTPALGNFVIDLFPLQQPFIRSHNALANPPQLLSQARPRCEGFCLTLCLARFSACALRAHVTSVAGHDEKIQGGGQPINVGAHTLPPRTLSRRA
jgi:hypothetical protein